MSRTRSIRRRLHWLLERRLGDLLWPVLRWRIAPEVVVRTHYPGCVVAITNVRGTWDVALTNGDPDKIASDQIRGFFHGLLESRLPDCRLTGGLSVDLRLDSVCLEAWRDICTGRIQRLIDDESDSFESDRVGAFGYLDGTTKPGRLSFVEQARKYPDRFEFITTGKYLPDMKGYVSLLDYKRKFRYAIDLPGHTYSTRSYWLLFLKRPLFYVEPVVKFRWEKRLRAWEHYIPVRRDFRDLTKRYQWARSHPDEVRRMASRLYDFGMRRMSPAQVLDRFARDVKQCVSPI